MLEVIFVSSSVGSASSLFFARSCILAGRGSVLLKKPLRTILMSERAVDQPRWFSRKAVVQQSEHDEALGSKLAGYTVDAVVDQLTRVSGYFQVTQARLRLESVGMTD